MSIGNHEAPNVLLVKHVGHGTPTTRCSPLLEECVGALMHRLYIIKLCAPLIRPPGKGFWLHRKKIRGAPNMGEA